MILLQKSTETDRLNSTHRFGGHQFKMFLHIIEHACMVCPERCELLLRALAGLFSLRQLRAFIMS